MSFFSAKGPSIRTNLSKSSSFIFVLLQPLIFAIYLCCQNSTRNLGLFWIDLFGGIAWIAPIQPYDIIECLYRWLPSYFLAYACYQKSFLGTSSEIRTIVCNILAYITLLIVLTMVLSVARGIPISLELIADYGEGQEVDISWLPLVSLATYCLRLFSLTAYQVIGLKLTKGKRFITGALIIFHAIDLWCGSSDWHDSSVYHYVNWGMGKRFAFSDYFGVPVLLSIIALLAEGLLVCIVIYFVPWGVQNSLTPKIKQAPNQL